MRYIVGFFITIGLIILILVLLFRGGDSPVAPVKKPLSLPDYTYTGAVARMIVDGPVVGDQKHNEIQIDVSQDSVTMNVYQGYQQTLLRSQTYSNNTTAWAVFLRSLQRAGYTLGDTSSALRDERGYCPVGTRSIYSLTNNGSDVMRFWRTSCGQGTAKGQTATFRYLFQKQVPDYSKLVAGINVF